MNSTAGFSAPQLLATAGVGIGLVLVGSLPKVGRPWAYGTLLAILAYLLLTNAPATASGVDELVRNFRTGVRGD
jgi:hypothetical protein